MGREVCAITSAPLLQAHPSPEPEYDQRFPDASHHPFQSTCKLCGFASPESGSAAEEDALELGSHQ